MSCICFEVLLKNTIFIQNVFRIKQSSVTVLYSECVQNKAVKRDCHLKEATAFTFVPIRLIRVREKKSV